MRSASLVTLLLGVQLAAPSAHAITILSTASPSSLGVIRDGTSNTILLGESSRGTLCFDGVGLDFRTADGTSNLVFGGGGGLQVTGAVSQRVPLTQITDGSSNTILLPETTATSLCLRDVRVVGGVTIGDGSSNTITIGEGTTIDACFNHVGVNITDGSSNTILIGENQSGVCFNGVRPDSTLLNPGVTVPEPRTIALLFAGLLALGASVRRRRAASG